MRYNKYHKHKKRPPRTFRNGAGVFIYLNNPSNRVAVGSSVTRLLFDEFLRSDAFAIAHLYIVDAVNEVGKRNGVGLH